MVQEMKRKPKDSGSGGAGQSASAAAAEQSAPVISRQPSLDQSGMSFAPYVVE